MVIINRSFSETVGFKLAVTCLVWTLLWLCIVLNQLHTSTVNHVNRPEAKSRVDENGFSTANFSVFLRTTSSSFLSHASLSPSESLDSLGNITKSDSTNVSETSTLHSFIVSLPTSSYVSNLSKLEETVVQNVSSSTREWLSTSSSLSSPSPLPPGFYITVPAWRVLGLGNYMFFYASLYGVARQANLSAYLRESHMFQSLVDNFDKLSIPKLDSTPKYAVDTDVCCKYYAKWRQKVKKASRQHGNIELDGFVQSWKYFHKFRDELVRKEFNFSEHIQKSAREEIDKLLLTFNLTRVPRDSVKIVGIHIRRGDYVGEDAYKRGYIAGSTNFTKTAINYLKHKSSREQCQVVFLVLTDDSDWCKRELADEPNLQVLDSGHRGIAMHLLSLCDVIVITAGCSTFAWWAAYLSEAKIFYNKEYVRSNSSLAAEMSAEDYFPPHWQYL